MMAMVRPATDSRSAMQTKHDIITVREAFLQNEIPPQRTARPAASDACPEPAEGNNQRNGPKRPANRFQERGFLAKFEKAIRQS
jgi:hypothetical protein